MQSDVRVIVLAGEGKHFSAGADLQWMQRASAGLDSGMEPGRCTQVCRRCSPASRPAPSPPLPVCRARHWAVGSVLPAACDIAVGSGQRQLCGQRSQVWHPARRHRPVRDQCGRQAACHAGSRSRPPASARQRPWPSGLVQQVAPLARTALDATVDATVQRAAGRAAPTRRREIKHLFAQLSKWGPITPEVCELTAQTISARARHRRSQRRLCRLPGQTPCQAGYKANDQHPLTPDTACPMLVVGAGIMGSRHRAGGRPGRAPREAV